MFTANLCHDTNCFVSIRNSAIVKNKLITCCYLIDNTYNVGIALGLQGKFLLLTTAGLHEMADKGTSRGFWDALWRYPIIARDVIKLTTQTLDLKSIRKL